MMATVNPPKLKVIKYLTAYKIYNMTERRYFYFSKEQLASDYQTLLLDNSPIIGCGSIVKVNLLKVDNLYHEVVGIVELDTFNPTSLIREKALAKLTEEEKKVLGLK